ncbi:MAG: type II toxin-antitoxin system death-on-curing family toxin [Pseudomonadota bacterium]
MTQWRWVSRDTVIALQDMQISQFGGPYGIRDEGLLGSALARPENQAAYREPDVFALAAAYAYGLVRNHPFVDGNKRIGLVVAAVFLEKNQTMLDAKEADAVLTILALAAGELSEAALADWFRANSVPVPPA